MLATIFRVLANSNFRPSDWRDSLHLFNLKFSTEKNINRLREIARITQKVIKIIQNPIEVSELEKEAWGNYFQIEKVKSHSLQKESRTL